MARPPITPEQRFARNFAAARKALGFNQRQVAERMRSRGFTWTLSVQGNVEIGRRRLRSEEAEALAEIVAVTVELLRTETAERIALLARSPLGSARRWPIAPPRRHGVVR